MSASTPGTQVPSSSSYQANKARSEKLLAAFRNGDAEAIRCFKERHPRGKDPDFSPQLIDARILTVSDTVRAKRLTLDPLRKQAKNLLKRWRDGDQDALARVAGVYPKTRVPDPGQAKLADAQLVIAREQGLASWPKLKAHADALDQADQAIATAGATGDPDPDTAHIRCGSDIQTTLSAAGLNGTFFNFEEVFVCGPLAGGADRQLDAFFDIRARYLSEAFPEIPDRDMSFGTVLSGLKKDWMKLESLIRNHDSLCLWFEHDTHDQLILAMLLHLLAGTKRTANIEIVSPDHFPGVGRFMGLGQLQPEMIRMLWDRRGKIDQKQITMGRKVWPAACAPDPTNLWKIAQSTRCPLPHMPRALRWHLGNLPDVNNGLSKVEQQSLQILARDGAINASRLFTLHNYEADPLPTLGDLSYLSILDDLIDADRPPVRYRTYDPDTRRFQRGDIELTNIGQALLANEVNWLDINDVDRWVGGVHIKSGQVNWCWHPDKGVLRQ